MEAPAGFIGAVGTCLRCDYLWAGVGRSLILSGMWTDSGVDDLLLETIAFEIARDLEPHADLAQSRETLDDIGRQVAEAVAAVETSERTRALCTTIFGALGFWGAPGDDDPADDLLPQVLERRRGSPVALAVVVIALARRAGLVLHPVAFPGHFLLQAEDGPFIDPVGGGQPLDAQRLLELATETLGDATAAQASMLPTGPRTVGVRLLCNLQRSFRAVGDHARAMVVFDRLFDLTHVPSHRLDRGAHALALGAVQAATSDFSAYLRAHPKAPDAPRIRQLLEKLGRLRPELN